MNVLLILLPVLILALGAWVLLIRRVVAPRIDARVSCIDSSVAHGTETEVTVMLRNPTYFPCPFVTCELQLPLGLRTVTQKEGRVSYTVALGRREVVQIHIPVTAVKRGRHHIHELTLRVADGFTMYRDSKQVDVFSTVTVHPRRIQTRPAHARFSQLGLLTSTRKLAPTSVDWIDMHSYQIGDSIRDVAWMTSARRGELIVLDRAVSMSQQVVLLASVRVSAVAWEVSEARADLVYETAFAMMEEMTRRGVQFLFYCDAYWANERRKARTSWVLRGDGVWSPRIRRQTGHVLGSLSISCATSVTAIFDEIERAVAHPARIVFLTGFVDPATQQRISAMKRRGDQVDLVWLSPSDEQGSSADKAAAP